MTTGEMAFLEMMFVFDHVTVIGGLMVVAVFGERLRSMLASGA